MLARQYRRAERVARRAPGDLLGVLRIIQGLLKRLDDTAANLVRAVPEPAPCPAGHGWLPGHGASCGYYR